MNLLELIQNRYSVRSYLPQAIEEEKLAYILECARLAPSACNFQPWSIYLVSSGEGRQAVIDAYPREWVKSAPMFIVLCKDVSQSWKRADGKDYGDVDVAIAAEHICLAAVESGLGTCWVCNFDLPLLSKGLNMPENEEVIAVFPIGYIDEKNSKIPERKRKSIPEIATWI